MERMPRVGDRGNMGGEQREPRENVGSWLWKGTQRLSYGGPMLLVPTEERDSAVCVLG